MNYLNGDERSRSDGEVRLDEMFSSNQVQRVGKVLVEKCQQIVSIYDCFEPEKNAIMRLFG